MKKNLKTHLAWILVGTIGLGIPGSTYSAKQSSQPLPSQKKSRLLRLLSKDFRNTYNLYRKKQVEGAPLEELRELDIHMLNIRRKAINAGLGAALIAIIAAIVGGMALEFSQDIPPIGSATLAALTTYGAIKTRSTRQLIWARENRRLREKYAKLAIEKLLKPKSNRRVQLLRKIRKLEATGNTANIATFKKETQQLHNEIEHAKKTFLAPLPALLRSWTNNYNLEKINLILEEYDKEITPTSPWYRIFVPAITKNSNDIKTLLAQGNIHLFDEPWVWPAVADVYYFESRPTKEQIAQLKQDVVWQKWYEYWTGIEQYARDLELLGKNETVQPMGVAERNKLITTIKERLFQMKIQKQGT